MSLTLLPLGLKEAERIVSTADVVLQEALFLFAGNKDWVGRGGGYFCLANGENGLPLLVVPIGEVPIEKAEKYLRLCQEKAKRLGAHPEQVSSWMSRNLDLEQYGGAIRARNLIFSFSGFPELGDEAVMLGTVGVYYLAKLGQSRVLSEIAEIVAQSNNTYWPSLSKFLSRGM